MGNVLYAEDCCVSRHSNRLPENVDYTFLNQGLTPRLTPRCPRDEDCGANTSCSQSVLAAVVEQSQRRSVARHVQTGKVTSFREFQTSNGSIIEAPGGNIGGVVFASNPPGSPDAKPLSPRSPRVPGSRILIRQGGLAMLPDNTGRRPQDAYVISPKPIGTGAFGTVQKSRSRNGDKVVALKTINIAALKGKIDLFRNEIEINASLDHPNVCRLYETFEDEKNCYLALELCQGGDLFDQLEGRGELTESDAAAMMMQILRALVYMHSLCIVHRDLKPENFLVVEKLPFDVPLATNTLKVIDFGCAKRFTRGPDGHAIPMKTKCGSMNYLAPEVWMGSYQERADVYSCGIILYVILSGTFPYDGTPRQMKVAAVNGGFGDELKPQVSEPAVKLIKKLCEIRVEMRPTAREALESKFLEDMTSRRRRGSSRSTRLGSDFVDKLMAFGAVGSFKRAAMHIVAHRTDDEQIKDIRKRFTKLDKNGDGSLTLEELSAGCAEFGLTSEQVKTLFSHIDTDRSGHIGYTEFCACMLERKDYENEEVCREVFRILDRNGSGQITVDDFRRLLIESSDAGDDDVYQEFAEVLEDIDAVDGITFPDFLAIMRSK